MARALVLPVAFLVAALSLGFFSMSREHESDPDPIKDSGAAHLKWLKPRFLIEPWKLETLDRVFLGSKEGISPRRLLAKRGSLTLEVTSLNDLRGKVRVETCAEALAFVRLQTSPTTYWAFPEPAGEIMPFDAVRKSGLYGDEALAKWLRELRQEGPYGFVEPATMRRLGIPRTSCVPSENGWFTISRTLAPMDPKSPLVRVREQVASDGDYRRTALEKKPRGEIPWFMPDPSWGCPVGMSCS